ncbi:MAG: threonine--tRNA ligase [Nanoarchaeota archaeon]|nr:threonine--tRNA ligase [Nanoarchaeota archaeon]
MKILSLHCDYLKFKAGKKAIKEPEELSEKEKKEIEIKEPLVIFTAVEKTDESDPKKITELLVENVLDLMNKVGAKKIILYPYAHLSSNLSSPAIALEVLKNAEAELKKKKIDVSRAPFGYYKEFELKCKGHPLAELSREILINGKLKPQETESALGKSQEITSIINKDEKYDPVQLLRQISKTKLDTSKLKENDHRILGNKLDLFSFNETAPGMVFWHNNGLIIYNELANYWREEHRKANYEEVSTPQILDRKLWQISGHWEKYKDNIFLTKYENRDFAVKPMSCPGGMLIFKSKQRSYKEIPLRMAELGVVHRQELSGTLAGLFRVIRITQDDAHIYCTEKQLEIEITNIIEMINKFYKKFNLPFDHVELSTRPEKRIGDDKIWDKAEKILEDVLKKKKVNYKINKGDGAFYGPKIDFHVKDSQGRTWQLSTIQLDFAMPGRFELEYIGEDNQKHQPIMLHNVIYGSLERFIGILLEHTNGNLPVWLSPIQVRVLSFTDRNNKACEKLVEKLKQEGIRVDIDLESTTVNDKVRNAELLKIPYIIVLGDKEEQNKTLALRQRGEKLKFGVKEEEFIQDLKEKINNRED